MGRPQDQHERAWAALDARYGPIGSLSQYLLTRNANRCSVAMEVIVGQMIDEPRHQPVFSYIRPRIYASPRKRSRLGVWCVKPLQ
jgi:hypothetical protein